MQETPQDQQLPEDAVPIEDYATWEAIIETEPNKYHAIAQKDFFNMDLPEELRPDYEHIPREKMVLFRMIHPASGRCILQIPFKKGTGSRLIWRRRVQKIDNVNQEAFYVVGKKGAFVNVILPDYSIVADDRFDEDSVLLNDIVPVRGEEGYEEGK